MKEEMEGHKRDFLLLLGLGFESGLHTCKTGTLPLEPHLQSILLWLFWRWGSYKLFAWTGLKWCVILPISASQVARIIVMSYQCPSTKRILNQFMCIQ
jgi:hypothetical protein